jgi:ADP-heptose:LPS heptosyltransferase
MKKALLIRFGGIGDSAPMGVVGAQLKKRGYHVTMACRSDGKETHLSDLYIGNPCFDKVLDIREIEHSHDRCVKTQLGWVSLNSIHKDFDLVLDYMNIIESNSTSTVRANGPENVWQATRNSNFVNWYDMHLAWANIDPSKVPDKDKNPKFSVTKEETKNILKLKAHYSHLVTIQASASSISRTWFQGKKLPEMILAKYPDALVAYWDQQVGAWLLISKDGTTKLERDGASPIRYSMALVAASDLYIGADTGFSHIAEGLGVPNIAVYSTVPAWTRNKYYTKQITVDPGQNNPEFYTFNLGLGDPLRVIEGLSSLTPREKAIEELYAARASAEVAAEALNTDTEGATLELESFLRKKSSFERQQSKALSTVSAEQVFELIKGVLK